MLKVVGHLEITPRAVRIQCGADFAAYYRWLVFKARGVWAGIPAHGAHVTLWNAKVHRTKPNLKDLKKGQKIAFFIDPEKIINGQGRKKNFQNWLFEAKGEELWAVIRKMGMEKEFSCFWSPHVVVCNTKGDLDEWPLAKFHRTIK